ncbi:tetraspanin-36-like [Hypanus sabinus]|uniref:tetraspanin-36-like n=1 Tax=Hypanus sabinus TaxID=79690 RepID=UPI0028C4BED6|nr:tetraspanin-36-like [Hypanus sabinus]
MDCGVVISKSVLLFISLIFWAAGGVLIYIGATLLSTYKDYAHFFKDQYTVLPAVVIIAIALVMFLFGIIGCCATLKESRCGLGLFLFILLVIFAAELSVFVLGLIYRRQVHEGVQKSMSLTFGKYDGKNVESRTVDTLQMQMHCCGIWNYTYWEHTAWFKKNHSVPLSCCKSGFSNCTGSLSDLELLNTAGCESKLEQGLEAILGYAVLIILIFAIIQFFGMISICVLACRRRDTGYQPIPSSGTYA